MEISQKIQDLIYTKKDDELIAFLKEIQDGSSELSWEDDLYIMTPLTYACELNRINTIKSLLENNLVNPQNEIEDTRRCVYRDPILIAATNNKLDIVKLLVDAGYPVESGIELFERIAGDASVEVLLKMMPKKSKAIYELLINSREKS